MLYYFLSRYFNLALIPCSRLAKIRMDVARWEELISDCYFVLRAMRAPVEMLGTVYK